MKKIFLLLLTVIIVLILPGCKKLVESLIPSIPNDSIPTVTEPIQTDVGTPVGDVVTKIIGKTGGSIASADDNAELIFPAGALADNTNISVQAVTQTAPNGVGYGYRFLPEGIQFQQPVTLKFHYTADDLAATLSDLMGIAFQDSVGEWWRVNNFSNDTANKIISAPIKHFTVYVPFDVLSINPPKENLKVNNSLNLAVEVIFTDDDELAPLGPTNEELAPLKKISSKKIIWSANGVVNGNSTSGTVASTSPTTATFKAPAKVPSQNPVAVSAQLDNKFKYHGKIFDKTSLVSNIKIFDGQKYLLEIRETETADPFVYKDTASMMVLVSAEGVVTVSDIANFAPITKPTVASVGDCTATWIPENLGVTNITGVQGTINVAPNGARTIILQFTQSGTTFPKFHRVCSNGSTDEGGFAIAGYPTVISIPLTEGGGIFFIDDGQEYAKLTLQD